MKPHISTSETGPDGMLLIKLPIDDVDAYLREPAANTKGLFDAFVSGAVEPTFDVVLAKAPDPEMSEGVTEPYPSDPRPIPKSWFMGMCVNEICGDPATPEDSSFRIEQQLRQRIMSGKPIFEEYD